MRTTTLTRTLAVAALALSALTLSGCSLLQSVLPGGSVLNSLKVGDCIDGAGGEGTVDEVPVVDCSEPHEEEVYFITDVKGDEFPGDEALSTEGDTLCYEAFDEFAGIAYEESKYGYWVLYPSSDTFALGDRQIVCTIALIDEAGGMTKVSGSLEGAAE